MASMSTNYMGLQLRNPIIVSSCSLTNNVEGVRRCSDAGAGAVVLKSLFEEQIKADYAGLEESVWPLWHTEAYEYIQRMGMEMGPREYLVFIEKAKNTVSIPIIASLNCISYMGWIEYAKQLEAAGADAIELNISVMPSNENVTNDEIENIYYKILEEVTARVKIPVAVKIGSFFTSLARMASGLSKRGAAALVLFNRFYQLDIDINKIEIVPGNKLSSPNEMYVPLRWIALLANRIKCDLAASTGIHNSAGIIKQIIAGASAVQICSILYLKNIDYISNLVKEVEEWLKDHSFDSIEQVRGTLSQMQSEKPELYERLQYVKALTGRE